MPDATYGVVRALGADDLEAAGVRAIMSNSYHLSRRPGVTTVGALGGLRAMMGWKGPIVTDSGGFQAYSLLHQDPSLGAITSDGLVFAVERGHKPIRLTPEKSVQNQLRLGSNVLFCLDDCTHPDAGPDDQRLSVERTVQWAKRCKTTFVSGLDSRRVEPDLRPGLFAVVQGGRDPALRRECAERLLEIGFDGFGYGGWPIDSDGALVHDLLTLTRALIPAEFRMQALGIGHPASIVACARMGYTQFDSALPTRDARRGRLYSFRTSAPDLEGDTKEWLELTYIQDERYVRDSRPLSEYCLGQCCQRYSRGYLRHLSKIEDPLFYRLATIHNLTFMRALTDILDAEKL
jgi:queuine tRNA-ribosyltransferase